MLNFNQELNRSFISRKPHSELNDNKFKALKSNKFDDLSFTRPRSYFHSFNYYSELKFSIPSTRGDKTGAIDIKVSVDFKDLLLILGQSLDCDNFAGQQRKNGEILNFILERAESISKTMPKKSMKIFLECLNVSTKINADKFAEQTKNVSESVEHLKNLRDSLNETDIETAAKIDNIMKNLCNK
jgi:hypothetical protein